LNHKNAKTQYPIKCCLLDIEGSISQKIKKDDTKAVEKTCQNEFIVKRKDNRKQNQCYWSRVLKTIPKNERISSSIEEGERYFRIVCFMFSKDNNIDNAMKGFIYFPFFEKMDHIF